MDGRGADGNLIKGATSGGDQHRVRGAFENSTKYVNRTTLFCLANDFTKITPSPAVDTGLQERLAYLRYPMKFVDEPSADNERLKDRSIKRKFETDEWKNALFHVIWRCWLHMPPAERELEGAIPMPPSVKAETDEWIYDGEETLSSVLEEQYEFTHDFADTVPSKEIVAFIVSKGLKMSSKKTGMEIRKMIHTTGWTEEQKAKVYETRSGNKTVYHGIRQV